MDDEGDSLWESIKSRTTPLDPDKKRWSPHRAASISSSTVHKKPNYTSSEQFSIMSKQMVQSSTKDSLQYGDINHLDGRTAKRFKRGNITIDFRLDLHGYTKDQAYDILIETVEEAYQKKKRCGLIITGKGYRSDGVIGVIKQSMKRWLDMPPLRNMVLAVTSASQKHGGEGAIYILLRRHL